MAVQQLSVFLENTPGHAVRLAEVLERSAVSIRGFSLADTGQFGIARFVVDFPDRALDALKSAGFMVSANEVLCVRLDDNPGELAQILAICAAANVNIEYAYSLVSTFVVLKVSDSEAALAQLEAQMSDQMSAHSLHFVGQDEIAAFRAVAQ